MSNMILLSGNKFYSPEKIEKFIFFIKNSDFVSPELCKGVELAFYEGKKINEIERMLGKKRRNLQVQITNYSNLIFKEKITFEDVRKSCILNLINKGFSTEYIQKFIGLSRKDTLTTKRVLKGYIKPKLRLKVFQRDGFECVYCKGNICLEADHIIPVSNKGKTNLGNLQTLCRNCNVGKGNNKVVNYKQKESVLNG